MDGRRDPSFPIDARNGFEQRQGDGVAASSPCRTQQAIYPCISARLGRQTMELRARKAKSIHDRWPGMRRNRSNKSNDRDRPDGFADAPVRYVCTSCALQQAEW